MRPYPLYHCEIDNLMSSLRDNLLAFQQIDTKRTPFILLDSQKKEIRYISKAFNIIDEWLEQNVVRNFFNDTRHNLNLDAIGLSMSYYVVISKNFKNLVEEIDNNRSIEPKHLYYLQLHIAGEFKTLFAYHFYIPAVSHLLREETTSIALLRVLMKTEPSYLATLITTCVRLKGNFPDSKQFLAFVQNSGDFFSLVGDSVYTRKCIFENSLAFSDPVIWARRLTFEKSGSKLIPLAGPMAGYLIRIIKKESYEAWKTAFEHGLQVEPLLRDKRGRYRARERSDGLVDVMTHYCGKNLMEMDASLRSDDFVHRQMQETIHRMDELGIIHGHCEDHNWCVSIANSRPRVTLIDWDQAVLHGSPLR